MTNHIKIYGVVPRKQYVADGNTTTYEFPFAIFSADDLEVYLNETKQSSSLYTVTGIRNSDGGSVTFTTAPTNNTIITIVRNLSIERTSDFQEGGALRADTLNDELDYQIACQQQLADNLNRSMVLPPYAADNNLSLTLPSPSAGKAIIWNTSGTNLENSTIAVNELESTLKSYKETAQSAASTATTKANIAADKATIATTQAQTATTQAGIATTKATEVATALSGKANKDMDNLSDTGKASLLSLNIPDYSAGITISVPKSSETYTAPKAGIYVLCYTNASSVSGKYLTVNGSNVYGFEYTSTGNPERNAIIVLDKDDVLSSDTNSVPGNIKFSIFYPLKGA